MDDETMRRLAADQAAGRGQRTWSKGRIRHDDDGDLFGGLVVDGKHRRIVLAFAKAVTWIAMTAAEARHIAKALGDAAEKLERLDRTDPVPPGDA